MSKETINNKQGISLIVLFLMGSSLVLPTAVQAGRDLWIAIIFSIVLGLLLFAVYARIHSLYPGSDLYDIIFLLFGKYMGSLISLIYIWFAFHLGAVVLRNFGEYLSIVGLLNTPDIIPGVVIIILCVWGVREGIEVLGRTSVLALIFLILIISFVLIISSSLWDADNLKPVLYNGYKPVLTGMFSIFSFPIAEAVLFLFVFSLDKNKNSPYKIYLYGLIIGGLVVLFTSINELLTLGVEIYSQSYFPSYIATRRANVFDFLQRLEIVPSVALIIAGFIKISICLMVSAKGIAKIGGYDDYRFIVLPLGLMTINLSHYLYDNIIEMSNWARDIWPYYSLPFQVIIPVIILVVAELKKNSYR